MVVEMLFQENEETKSMTAIQVQCTSYMNSVSMPHCLHLNITNRTHCVQACQVSRIGRVTHAIGSFHTLPRKPGLFSRIFVHAWNRDMASNFTSVRDRRVKMPRVLAISIPCANDSLIP